MFRLMFVCQCKPMHSAARIDAMQTDIWRRCDQKGLSGFLLRHDRSFVGVLEGAERDVVGQVEHLIRKHHVESVDVLYECVAQGREWATWITRYRTVGDVPDADLSDLEGLAQNVKDAVEADQRNS